MLTAAAGSRIGIDTLSYTIRLSRRGLRFRPLVIDDWFMALGLWEPYVRRKIHLSPGDAFLDIGSHIGYYARLAAEEVGDSGMVICVEPDPRNARILQVNIEGYTQVQSMEKACGREHATSLFLVDSNPLYSRLSQGGRPEPSETQSSVAIEVVTLDWIWKTSGLPSAFAGEVLLKIDVEGTARDVVLGGLLLIQEHRPRILIEASDSDIEKLLGLLPGYRADKLSGADFGYHCLDPMNQN